MSTNKTLPLEKRMLPPQDSGRCPVYVRRLPPCKDACPSSEDIRGYLTRIAQGELFGRSMEESLDEAWHILTSKNPFPAVIGRICPHPCETACNRRMRDWPVNIHNMERYIGDHGLRRGLGLRRLTDELRPEAVAVVGAGPAGMSCAWQLARRGYPVTVFEAADAPGGMLRSGIPAYRLPREVLDAEFARVVALGVEIRYGSRVGHDIAFDKLRGAYRAVYLALGAQEGIRLDVAGSDLPNVIPAQEFISLVNRGKLRSPGQRVVVVGGGNAAIDAARLALRLGAGVTVAYRRTRFDMPAIPSEVAAAESEGVGFEFQASPLEISAAGAGKTTRLEAAFIRTAPGSPDASGRPRPVPVEGSVLTLPADTVVMALGQKIDMAGIDGLTDKDGNVAASPAYATGAEGVFAGGDMIGPGFATTAIGQGREAARAIADFLDGRETRRPYLPAPIPAVEMRLDYYPVQPRNENDAVTVEERIRNFQEVNLALGDAEALDEAGRCMSCGRCFVCDRCRVYCPWEAISKDMEQPVGYNMFTDYARCSGCSVCAMTCPCRYIEMGYGP